MMTENETLRLAISGLGAAFPSAGSYDALRVAAERMLAAGYEVRVSGGRSKYGFRSVEIGGQIECDLAAEDKLRKAWDHARKNLPGMVFSGTRQGGRFYFVRTA